LKSPSAGSDSLIGSNLTESQLSDLAGIPLELLISFAGIAGSKEKWARRKAELSAGGRWVELLY
jgi:hypothetical protein